MWAKREREKTRGRIQGNEREEGVKGIGKGKKSDDEAEKKRRKVGIGVKSDQKEGIAKRGEGETEKGKTE